MCTVHTYHRFILELGCKSAHTKNVVQVYFSPVLHCSALLFQQFALSSKVCHDCGHHSSHRHESSNLFSWFCGASILSRIIIIIADVLSGILPLFYTRVRGISLRWYPFSLHHLLSISLFVDKKEKRAQTKLRTLVLSACRANLVDAVNVGTRTFSCVFQSFPPNSPPSLLPFAVTSTCLENRSSRSIFCEEHAESFSV